MNSKDKQDLELVHYSLDELDKKMDQIRHDMSMAHGKTDASLSFLKENLFNPNEGLWAETKQNTQFREKICKIILSSTNNTWSYYYSLFKII